MKVLRFCFILVLFGSLLTACSLKKNTAFTRNYTAFITRYNIYFNGDEHYKQTLKDMENKYQDDYTRILFMHPAEAKNDETAPQPSGDFKRSIEKAQKAIQLRSIKKRPARKAGKGNDPEYKAWLKREEYNPFLHNAWMMMARSQYMNGDFLGAASTFFYISKHFTWLPATVTEARLWQARSYCAIDWLFEAESILTRIKEKDLTTNRLRDLYNFAWADYYIRSHQPREAIPFLEVVASRAKGQQKYRLTFLLGQLYQNLGEAAKAYECFHSVSKSSGAAYRARFNARIRQSEVFEGADISSEVKALRGMARQRSNKEFLDQIYYAIGNLYLSRGDTVKAIDNYKLAVDKSTRNGIDKALAQITLGQIYFKQGNYDLAQPCYAEAIPLIPATNPDYTRLKRESDVLDELAVYSQNVTLQDSLLRLSKMSPEEQLKVVEGIITRLKEEEKKAEEERRREEYLAQQAAAGNGLQNIGSASQAPSTFVMNTDNSWYFYNQATRNAGRTEFQKRWGSRRLEDDWRRRNKASFSLDGTYDNPTADGNEDSSLQPDSLADAEGGDSAPDRELEAKLNDPHYPEYYLKQIPKTDEERKIANDVIMDGLYNMGLILKDKLGDPRAAETEFGRLMTRYPDNPYRLEVYNNLFLMYLRAGQTNQVEHYRQLILSEFPDSKIAEALRPADYATRFQANDSIQEALYEQAYEAYLSNRNSVVHRICADVRAEYPMSRIMPKFMFINALAYVTENKPEEFAAQLHELVERYPDADVSPLATDYLNLLQRGRKLNTAATSNMRGMAWSMRMAGDSTFVEPDAPAKFDFSKADAPQYLVLLYRTDAVDANTLLFNVARFNFNTFTVRDFDLETMQFGTMGLLIVKGFNSVSEVERYRSMLEKGVTLPQGVVPVAISEKNFNVLLNEGRSFEEYFDAIGDKRLEEVHTAVLPPDTYPSAKEMYDRDSIPSLPLEILPAENAADSNTIYQPDPEDSDITPALRQDEPSNEPDEYDIPVPEPPKGKPAIPSATERRAPVSQPAPETEPQETRPAPAVKADSATVRPDEQKAQPEPSRAPAAKQSDVPKPKPKPRKEPAPVPMPSKPRPAYPLPEGSEGDDPLLDY